MKDDVFYKKTLPGAGVRPLSSVLKTLRLLDHLGSGHNAMRLAEVAKANGMSRATAHQKLVTLVQAGWAEQTKDGAYRLTLHATSIGIAALSQASLGERVMPFLQKLVAESKETVSLAVLCIRCVRASAPVWEQQQRVALARALVFEPDVLLLDEPLGALDKNLREQMQIEIKRIHRDLGVTTVYVTHDQTEAMTMSDRIAVFNAGRVEQVSQPMDIYRRPQTRFVASFVGDNNVLDATVSESEESRFQVENVGIVTGVSRRLPKNARILIAIRPEAIRRSSDGEASSLNRFFLRVSGVVNYGDSILLHGTINGQPMRVRLSASDVASVRDGEGLWIGWSAEDVHVIHGNSHRTEGCLARLGLSPAR